MTEITKGRLAAEVPRVQRINAICHSDTANSFRSRFYFFVRLHLLRINEVHLRDLIIILLFIF